MNSLVRLAAASALVLMAGSASAQVLDLLDPPVPSVTGSYLAGQQALSELRTPDAVTYFRQALPEEWENPLLVERAFVAFAANGEIDQAADTARHLLELEPGSQLARLVLATEALKQRRYPAAIRDLDNLGADTFESITGSLLKAWAEIGGGDFAGASRVLDNIANGGLEEFLVFHRAIMAEVAGRSDDAIAYITEAHEADPNTADIVEAYARILGNAGRTQDALDAIVGFEAQGLNHPIVAEVKEALARNRRPGMYADSVQAGAAIMFHSIGVALAREGSAEIGLVLLRLGAYLDPKNETIALVIGQVYDGAGQHELANAIYDAVPAGSPFKPMAVVRVADNLDATGDRTEAIRRLNNIIVANPGDVDALSVLGDLLRSDKQYDEAAKAYTKALAITGGASPGDWRFYYVRAIAYERADKFPLAETDFLKALDLNPDQPQVLNYLGYSWVNKGMNLDRALDMINKAISAAPNDGYIIDSLGWAYYRLGRFDEAVVQLEQAAALRPEDPEINDHLGDAYWQVGRKLEARFQWNIAFAVDTEGEVKKRVEPKLVDGLEALPLTPESAPIEEVPARQPVTQ